MGVEKKDVNTLVIEIQNGREDLINELWGEIELFVKSQINKRLIHFEKRYLEYFNDIVNQCYIELHTAVYKADITKGGFLTYFDFSILTALEKVIYSGRGDRLRNDPLNNYASSLDAEIENKKDGSDDLKLYDLIADPDALKDFERLENNNFWEDVNTFLWQIIDDSTDGEGRKMVLYMLNNNATYTETIKHYYKTDKEKNHGRIVLNNTFKQLQRYMRKSTVKETIYKMGLDGYLYCYSYSTSVSAWKYNNYSSATERAAFDHIEATKNKTFTENKMLKLLGL